jgi:RNA polymerase sigma factor (sigma-70 family)
MSSHASPLLQFLRRVAGPPVDATDADLLRRFACGQDEGAFAALLGRHGPMVLGVCERVLRNRHDAEDACQATFLVLARKARRVDRPELLGNWLYGVAFRTARKARARVAERRAKERRAVRALAEDAKADVVWADLRPVLDEEVSRLPDKFRLPFVLCYLQGRTNAQAAQALGCPKGTVLSRLATARERLRSRLTRRGVVLSAGLLAAALSEGIVSAAIPAALATSTAQAALGIAAGQAAAGLVSAEVAALMKGTLRAMLLSKLKVVALAVLATAVLGTGGVVLTHQIIATERPGRGAEGKEAGPSKPRKDEDAIQGTWKLVHLDQVNHEPTKDEKAAWAAGSFKVVITAYKIIYPDKIEGTYQLDPTKTPKRFDFTIVSDQKTAPGIYSLDGDELRICIGRAGDREPPASFDVKKARGGMLPTSWTYQRDDAPPEKGKDADKAPEGSVAKELKALQGDWNVVELASDGQKASADDVKGMRWTFKGSELSGANPGEKPGDKSAKVKIDPSQSPRHFDLTIPEGESKGKTMEGIYKLADGRLTVCLRDPEKGRPTEFTAEKGSNQGLITLEKAKK